MNNFDLSLRQLLDLGNLDLWGGGICFIRTALTVYRYK